MVLPGYQHHADTSQGARAGQPKGDHIFLRHSPPWFYMTTKTLEQLKANLLLFFTLTGREMQTDAVIKALIDYKKADSG